MSLKVLHLIDSGGLYGAERMLLTLVEAQQSQGLDPMILSAGEPGIESKGIEKEADRLGLPIIAWRMKPGLNRSETRRICEWADQWGADIIHSHGYKFNILLGLFGRFNKTVPVVTTLHGYVHAPRFTRMWAYELLDRLALWRMSAVVLVGEAMKRELPLILRQSSRIAVIRNGLKVEDILRKSKDSLPTEISEFVRDHEPVILGVGRLSPEKGFTNLVLSFREFKDKFPRAGLLIAGEGFLRDTLERDISNNKLEKDVLLPGYYPNIPALMARSKVLVISSTTEGLPITLLEAMALQLPIVSTCVGEIPRVLENGANGILVNGSEREIAGAMESVLEDALAARKRSERGRQKVLHELSSQSMADQYEKVYRRALAS